MDPGREFWIQPIIYLNYNCSPSAVALGALVVPLMAMQTSWTRIGMHTTL